MILSPWWFLVALGIFLIGLTKSGFGGSVGLLNIPLITLAMSHIPGYEAASLGLMLPLLIIGDVLAVVVHRKHFAVSLITRLLPSSIVGVVIGYFILNWFHQQNVSLLIALIKIEVGCESILLTSLNWYRLWRGDEHKLLPEPLRSTITGTFVGTSSTLAHAAGPIAAMYLLPLKIDRRTYVGTNAVYFFLVNNMKLPFYFSAGMFAQASPMFSLRFAPLVLLGAIAGWQINKRMSDASFNRFVYFVTFLLGGYVLFDGIRSVAS